MSRWHSASCDTPDVIVKQLLPFCKACNAVPDIDALISAPQNSSTFSPIPPDERPGQFNLYWPRAVPYSRGADGRGSQLSGRNEVTSSRERKRSSGNFKPSPVYGRRLAPHEFRLLRLDAVTLDTELLHVGLEIYNEERCPEYETVSYTWGGENDNTSRCRPIFIGSYWDILLQTENCWDMLRFLRPWDGLRRVWVDAICINQRDDQERGSQVSKMARIYEGCQRVIVYLGKDATTPTKPGQFPVRQRLESAMVESNDSGQLIHAGKVNLSKLLEKRYFKRVWIIQELILSRQVVIQVCDTELWADGMTTSLLPDYDWKRTAAPWIVYMAQRQFPGKTIYQIMRDTWASKAADPRDRIFGVLALLTRSDERADLQPDYSLSCLHAFFGIFAYSLLKLKETEVLSSAAGIFARDGHPSWMIDWEYPSLARSDHIQNLTKSAFAHWRTFGWPRKCVWPLWLSDRPRDNHAELQRSGAQVMLQFSTEHKRWRRTFNPGEHEKIFNTDFNEPVPEEILVENLHWEEQERLTQETWDRDATIDTATGSLKINLTRLLRFYAVPKRIHEHGGMGIFEVQAANAAMYLFTDFPLDEHIIPHQDHLFVLDEADQSSFLLLILREVETRALPIFRLVACCYQLYFRMEPERWKRRSRATVYSRFSQETEATIFVGIQARTDKMLFLPDLRSRAKRPDIPGLLRGDKVLAETTFLGSTAAREVMPVFQGLLNEETGAVPGFMESYCGCINQQFQPIVDGDYVTITLRPEHWSVINKSGLALEFVRLYKEMRYEDEDDWKGSGKLRFSFLRKKSPVQLRASKTNLIMAIKQSETYRALSKTRYLARLKSDAEFLVPEEESGFVTCPTWPAALVKGFAIDGRMFPVCIV